MLRGIVGVEARLGRLHAVAEDLFGHARARRGRDRVRGHAVAAHLRRLHERERGDAGLGRRVRALADAAHEARARRRVDDAAVDRRRRPSPARASTRSRGGSTAKWPLRCTRITASHSSSLGGEHHAVAEEARVVHEHVEAAERVDRGVHEPARAVPVGDVVGVRDRLAADRDDLVDDVLRGPCARRRCRRARRRGRSPRPARPRGRTPSACSRPMPRPAPVTMTIRPSQIPVTGPYPTVADRFRAELCGRPWPRSRVGRVSVHGSGRPKK